MSIYWIISVDFDSYVTTMTLAWFHAGSGRDDALETAYSFDPPICQEATHPAYAPLVGSTAVL